MTADAWGLLTLALYAALAVWLLVVCARRDSPDGWQLWVLNIIARFHTPFFFRQHITGDCPLPADDAGLVLANHRSPVDPMLIFSSSPVKQTRYRIRRVEFLTAAEYCDLGGPLGFITKHMHVIPVARSGRDMGPVKEALRRIKDGKLVGVFPEGRINTGSGLLPGSSGVAWLALHSRAPVYPVFIHDAPQGESMVAPFVKFCRSHVTYGEPVDLSAYYGRRISQPLLDEVTHLLMSRLAQLGGFDYAPTCEEPPLHASNGNGAPHVAGASSAV
jgi:1-acyl-sn-glycerol-3-phosphate acyltransferase